MKAFLENASFGMFFGLGFGILIACGFGSAWIRHSTVDEIAAGASTQSWIRFSNECQKRGGSASAYEGSDYRPPTMVCKCSVEEVIKP